jgi:hypothetical protein
MKKSEQNSGPGRAIFLEGTRNFFLNNVRKKYRANQSSKKNRRKNRTYFGGA